MDKIKNVLKKSVFIPVFIFVLISVNQVYAGGGGGGGVIIPPSCTNGALNYSACDTCPTGKVLYNNVCMTACTNGAINPSACNQCSAGEVFYNNVCMTACTNGAINPTACNVCASDKVLVDDNPTFATRGARYAEWMASLTCKNTSGNPVVISLRSIDAITGAFNLVASSKGLLATGVPFTNDKITADSVCIVLGHKESTYFDSLNWDGRTNYTSPKNNFHQYAVARNYKCEIPPSCTNGALNYSACNTCPTGKVFYNNRCETACTNGAINPTTCNTCPSGQTFISGRCEINCTNGAINPSACNACSTGKVFYNNRCETPCTNGAINPTACNQCAAGKVIYNNRCETACTNGATNPPSCNICQNSSYYFNLNTRSCIPNPCGVSIPPVNHNAACPNGTNACGQFTSGIINCSGLCSATVVNNNSCVTFVPSTSSIVPNGSLEFSWVVANPTGVFCNFYDKSKDVFNSDRGTPIPSLQNLPASANKAKINNILKSTEFRLYCNYPTSSVPAISSQWVRVIKIGEK